MRYLNFTTIYVKNDKLFGGLEKNAYLCSSDVNQKSNY